MFAAFHPHHVGAEIGEQARAKRAGEHVSEVKHANAGELKGDLDGVAEGPMVGAIL